MSKLIRQIALVSESRKVDLKELTAVSAALQRQVTRDVSPIWDISATVDAFATLEDVPINYWPMIAMDDIGYDGAAGIHLDKDGQPFALITSSNDHDVWSLTASHECLEMLVDPFGNRLMAGDSPKRDQGRVSFLVEVCDPSEAADFAYSVNGVMVSDFYTPAFFDPVTADGVRYSFTSAIREPRDVLPGGYLTWQDAETEDWWQEIWFDGAQSTFRNLGKLSAMNGSIRAQVDRITAEARSKSMARGRSVATAAGLTRSVVRRSTSAKAASLRAQIEKIVGTRAEPMSGAPGQPEADAAPSHRRSAPAVSRVLATGRG
ncbi:MAG TPA: hypothetical protein VMS55_27305 [Myxococcota bacterium]|nr:hypothetical protein [Myxococcota bacterium]